MIDVCVNQCSFGHRIPVRCDCCQKLEIAKVLQIFHKPHSHALNTITNGISPLKINSKKLPFWASNVAWCNKKKSDTKVSLVCIYSISKTVGIFADNKDSITCRFHSLNRETSMFCFCMVP